MNEKISLIKASTKEAAFTPDRALNQSFPSEGDPGTSKDGVVFSLLDGATSQIPIIAPELETQKAIAADRSADLNDRLEAFEDILDSEVGDTTLARARNLERELGFRQIFLKFEGSNPTGTQKDRIAFAQAIDALRRGFDVVTVATCGNYGTALAFAASMAGLRSIIYIPEGYHTRRIQEMLNYGTEIIRVKGHYEDAVDASKARAEADELYDANPGGKNSALQLKTYGEIAFEIYDELRDAPALVSVPVSNGTTLVGIYKGFLSLYRRGKTSRIPKIVAGSSHGKNPIIRAYLKNSPNCSDLEPTRIRETIVNEPLINWHSSEGDYALEAIRQTGGWASDASDKSMLAFSKLLREREGLNVLPASTAGLSVLLDFHRKQALPGDRYVIILTGRRS